MSSGRFTGLSLTARLTVLYTLTAFSVLSLVTGYLFWAYIHTFDGEYRAFLVGKIGEMRVVLRDHSGEVRLLREEIEHELVGSPTWKFYVRVLDADGGVIAETGGMKALLPMSAFPDLRTDAAAALQPVRWRSPDQVPYVLVADWSEPGNSAHEGRLIQVGIDASQEEVLEAHYGRTLAITLVVGVLLSSVAGAVVARRGLRPLRRISEEAARVSASHLDRRIGKTPWPSELATLATAFDGMLARLERSFALLSQFSADLAHELRTPINNLVGEAEIALSRSRSAEEYRGVIESSIEECERLKSMIESLLFLAHAEAEQDVLRQSEFQVEAEIEDVRKFFGILADERSIALECRGSAAVRADRLLFRRAVSNLVSNAIDHTPDGGRIEISVEKLPAGGTEIRVADTGCGIPAEHIPRVFDRFYRVDPSRSGAPRGTGLGLAIVQSIMELHGGQSSIESAVNKGTTVRLLFPSPAGAPTTTRTRNIAAP